MFGREGVAGSSSIRPHVTALTKQELLSVPSSSCLLFFDFIFGGVVCHYYILLLGVVLVVFTSF